jgi:GT2 family glycosyltransferase/glycosyltransferase involved in cell wall biosynthesis
MTFANPRCLRAALYWAFDKETFSALQSARTWAFAGAKHVSLSFAVPHLTARVVGLQLALEPPPSGVSIERIRVIDKQRITTFTAKSSDQITGFAGFARLSPSFGEPERLAVEGVQLQISASEQELATIRPGCIIEFILSVDFAEQGTEQPEDDLLPGKHQPIARQLYELRGEVQRLSSALEDVYRSDSWNYTKWCRELATVVRSWPVWAMMTKRCRQQNSHAEKSRKSGRPSCETVDVIIPVFNGFHYVQECLASVQATKASTGYEIVVVDDASTDEALVELLDEMSSAGLISLLRNQKNTGFTATVNRGISLHPERDVILLNSDTIVSHDWIDRLRDAAYSDESIATVTPFSNNGTICSYPRFGYECELPSGSDASQLDRLFAEINRAKRLEIPTAVGFCMFVKRSSIAEVGMFDDATFPGYGEENDFCERALKLGWKHVLAADTFVYHAGGASYAEAQRRRKVMAHAAITKVHPTYTLKVQQFIQSDPGLPLRKAVDLARLRSSSKPLILFVLHGLAGGTEKHAIDLAGAFAENAEFLSIRAVGDNVKVAWLNDNEGFVESFNKASEWNEVLQLLRSLPIRRVHVHHFHGLERRVLSLIDDLGLPYDLTIHDFYAVCPQGWLCGDQRRYCGQPDEDGCNRCLTVLPHKDARNIAEWRERYVPLIDNAQRVFVPSRDAVERIKRYLPARSFLVTPHLETGLCRQAPLKPRQAMPGEPLRIVVLGLLNAEKGADLLDECAQDAVLRNLPIEFHFLGAAYQELSRRPRGALICYGPYKDDHLQELLAQVSPHLAWFPAQCPETYSYTLSACLRAALPVVAPNIGAFPERLAGREWTWVRPWDQSAIEWNDHFLEILSNHFSPLSAPTCAPGNPPLFSPFGYERDYLRPLGVVSKSSLDDIKELTKIVSSHSP